MHLLRISCQVNSIPVLGQSMLCRCISLHLKSDSVQCHSFPLRPEALLFVSDSWRHYSNPHQRSSTPFRHFALPFYSLGSSVLGLVYSDVFFALPCRVQSGRFRCKARLCLVASMLRHVQSNQHLFFTLQINSASSECQSCLFQLPSFTSLI